MIRVVMLGRLGNNLFQYAVARALAARHGVPVLMDGGRYGSEDWKQVRQIARLPVKAEIRRGRSLVTRAMNRLFDRHPWEWSGLPVIREDAGKSGFDPRVIEGPANAVLIGYFQSHRYFESIEPELRTELDLGGLGWSARTLDMAARLESENVVAIHIRRTDYLGREVFDVCGPGYYRRAIQRMRELQGHPRFVVFSDDPAGCRAVLGEEDVEVCDLPEAAGDPFHDLFLMSRAGGLIIANSSYSWWAAWLGNRPGRRVIAPGSWFGGGMTAPLEDKILPDWEVVPVHS